MAVARRPTTLPPVGRSASLDAYPGQWVALLEGQVIAHSPSARDVVRQMKLLGQRAEGAVLTRAASVSDAVAVGLG